VLHVHVLTWANASDLDEVITHVLQHPVQKTRDTKMLHTVG
jgi:hypothetical protein